MRLKTPGLRHGTSCPPQTYQPLDWLTPLRSNALQNLQTDLVDHLDRLDLNRRILEIKFIALSLPFASACPSLWSIKVIQNSFEYVSKDNHKSPQSNVFN